MHLKAASLHFKRPMQTWEKSYNSFAKFICPSKFITNKNELLTVINEELYLVLKRAAWYLVRGSADRGRCAVKWQQNKHVFGDNREDCSAVGLGTLEKPKDTFFLSSFLFIVVCIAGCLAN
ncbi:hypothetical protein CEXT_763771 [Caerostris extrusa]|uniref:Uncharacterized protein n=1 Tax=Caerostris extrusa TaxID=172846 RepID=A0AAV4WD96_CAEEX|nr:hypothetical protein CEXT_763771 [Caerostris extrusa]